MPSPSDCMVGVSKEIVRSPVRLVGPVKCTSNAASSTSRSTVVFTLAGKATLVTLSAIMRSPILLQVLVGVVEVVVAVVVLVVVLAVVLVVVLVVLLAVVLVLPNLPNLTLINLQNCKGLNAPATAAACCSEQTE